MASGINSASCQTKAVYGFRFIFRLIDALDILIMKKGLVLLICFFIISFQQLSAQKSESMDYYESQFYKYSEMKKKGIVLLSVGGVAMVGGIALAASANWQEEPYPGGVNYTSDDPAAIGGILLVLGSIPFTVVGTIFSIRGSRKKNEFEQKLNNLSIYPVKSSNYTGLGLSYNF